MPTSAEWSVGYARQARADLAAWNLLEKESLPECQKLHFLQMTCEKIVKAYLCGAGSDPSALQSSHAYTTKNLPNLIHYQLALVNAKPKLIRSIVSFTKRIAREIELLAPAVDDGGRRPDNCEYPWVGNKGELCVPVDWKFFASQLLTESKGRTLLKLISDGIERLASGGG